MSPIADQSLGRLLDLVYLLGEQVEANPGNASLRERYWRMARRARMAQLESFQAAHAKPLRRAGFSVKGKKQ